MAQFWTKVFALTFAMGVATGIVMEFEFGTNWATYSRFVGDVFGSALAAEGHLRLLPGVWFLGHPAFRMEPRQPQAAFLFDSDGLPRGPLQRDLDRRGQLLDADAGRLPHRRGGAACQSGDHRLLGDGV